MLLGEFEHTLDGKGRIVIPSKLRVDLGNTFIAARSVDSCVTLYPLEGWNSLIEHSRLLSYNNQHVRAFLRLLLSSAMEVSPDDQGRVLLSSTLKELASLKKNVIIIGVGDKAEVWDSDKWIEYKSLKNNIYVDIAEEVNLLG